MTRRPGMSSSSKRKLIKAVTGDKSNRIARDKLEKLHELQRAGYWAAVFNGHTVPEVEEWPRKLEVGSFVTSETSCQTCLAKVYITTRAGNIPTQQDYQTNVYGRAVHHKCSRPRQPR